ncbi:Protein Y32F6A.4 [Aphelenchoides avenae]|nr:Protein Y32F6A.4 [Aphelenchus avenae]
MDSNEASNSKETLSTRSTSEAELEPKWVWCRTVVVDEPAESVDEDHGDGYFRDGKFERRKGLNGVVTGLFLIGDIITGGLVALPSAMIQSYLYIGLGLNLLTAVVACYTSYVLGLCWVILLRRWPEYRSHCRKPYAELGYRAVGPKMKFIVSVCLNITQFGIAVVYLLLSSKNIHDFVQWASGTDFNDCYVILCVALGLLPITFLKSPADFWQAVVLAMVAAALSVILMCTGAIYDYQACSSQMKWAPLKVDNVLVALGTIFFSYGGHGSFPTVQHDMKKPHEFTKSSILAFSVTFVLYTLVCVPCTITYGDSIRESIINSLQVQWIQQTVNILVTLNCILTLTIVFNPLNQEAEELLGIPQCFGVKRVLLRTGVLAAVVFFAETVPSFAPVLDFIGGSTLTLTSLVFPCIFYVYLRTGEEKASESGAAAHDEPPSLREVLCRTSRVTLVICAFIMIFALIGGGAGTFMAVKEFTTTNFQPPCYVAPFLAGHDEPVADQSRTTNCCGRWQNVSRDGNSAMCREPKLDFYVD